MKERIKFRQAIFKKNGKFSHWHYWGFINESFIGIETSVSTVEEASRNSQQAIGRKDKNKKEIYEGDILKIEITDLKEIVYLEIWWDWFHSEYSNIEYFKWYSGSMEIIGNIIENPELVRKIKR